MPSHTNTVMPANTNTIMPSNARQMQMQMSGGSPLDEMSMEGYGIGNGGDEPSFGTHFSQVDELVGQGDAFAPDLCEMVVSPSRLSADDMVDVLNMRLM
jgi:hypothetical protein